MKRMKLLFHTAVLQPKMHARDPVLNPFADSAYKSVPTWIKTILSP